MFSKFVAWFGRSRKAIAGLVTAVLSWCTLIANQDGGFHRITAAEWVALAIAVATALSVYGTSNDPQPGTLVVKAPETVSK